MGQVLFLVWRESVEAMLVIGILYAWLNNYGVVAALTGYRAHPALMSLLAYGMFWLLITGLMRWRQQQPAA